MHDNLHTWPQRIYLVHSHDGYPIPAFKVDTDDVHWAADRVYDCDIEYVRSDLVSAPAAPTKQAAMPNYLKADPHAHSIQYGPIAAPAAPKGDKNAADTLVAQLTGALRFILAFYEPGQTYLDTNAWTQAEAGGRRALAAGEAAIAASQKQEPK